MQPTTLDPVARTLTKAIGYQEGGGQLNYNAVGDSGKSAGAYQWNNGTTPLAKGAIPANFQTDATKYGLNPNDFSPTNQNQVAYTKVKALLDSGMKPSQVASVWNAGMGEPNAFTGKFSNGTASTTSAFNVPGYVKGVQKYAMQLWDQDQNNQSPTAQAPTTPDSALNGFQNTVAGLTGGKQLAEGAGFAASGLGNTYEQLAADNDKQVSALIDQAKALPAGDPRKTDLLQQAMQQSSQLASSINQGMGLAPTNKQVVGSALQLPLTLATVGSLSPAAAPLDLGTEGGAIASNIEGGVAKPFLQTGLGRIASNTALGAGIGAAGAMANGGSVGSGAVTGGLTGAALGTVAEALTKLADHLPTRFVKQMASNLNPNASAQLLDDWKMGSISKNLTVAENNRQSLGNVLGQILKSSEYSDVRIGGDEMASVFQEAFPNNERTPEELFSLLKKQVPNDAALVTKLEKGELTLPEANNLKSALDDISYKLNTDTPEVKASKTLAATFGNALRAAVKKEAPETIPFFDRYSNEKYIIKTLKGLAKGKSGNSILKGKDLIGPLLGGGVGGLLGGLPGVFLGGAAEKLLMDPGTVLSAAKAIQTAAPAIKAGVNVAKVAGTLGIATAQRK